MENKVLERIKNIMREFGLSPRAFAHEIGFNYSTLNNYLCGRRQTVDSDLIVKTLKRFDDVSAEWLLRGTGSMKKDESLEGMNTAINMLIGENRVLREQVGLGERKDLYRMSA